MYSAMVMGPWTAILVCRTDSSDAGGDLSGALCESTLRTHGPGVRRRCRTARQQHRRRAVAMAQGSGAASAALGSLLWLCGCDDASHSVQRGYASQGLVAGNC
jgi:hypothetical protein